MSLVTLLILVFLWVSLLFYVLFGGADFGAGILELFLGRHHRDEQRKLIGHAMAPVWEANHVWLILAIVITFVGFPPVYTLASVSLHMPLLLVLLGIVGRGCAFTFRHYDTLTRTWYRTYSRVFALSSLWTALLLGMTAGAFLLGRVDPDAPGFAEAYLAPWLNAFCLATGVFTCALFATLAAVYLVGEAHDPALQQLFRRRARVAGGVLVLSGAAVFLAAEINGLPLLSMFFAEPVSIGAFVLATLLLLPLGRALSGPGRATPARVLGALVVMLVLVGAFAVQYPVAIRLPGGAGLSFAEAAAPPSTQRALLVALVVGSLLIFPALGWLFAVFKRETFNAE